MSFFVTKRLKNIYAWRLAQCNSKVKKRKNAGVVAIKMLSKNLDLREKLKYHDRKPMLPEIEIKTFFIHIERFFIIVTLKVKI